MQFKIQRYKRSKRIKIRVSISGAVSISAPLRTSVSECNNFVLAHMEWIEKSLQKAKIIQTEILNTRKKLDGKILYFGKLLNLKIDGSLKQNYLLTDDALVLKKSNLDLFYKTEARRVFESKCAEIAPFYGIKYGKIRIGAPKTRWGSCSSNKTLSFNYNLLKAPHGIIEYVVIHELCHIIHHNHSKEYWDEVKKLCPDFAKQRAWLKKHSYELSSEYI